MHASGSLLHNSCNWFNICIHCYMFLWLITTVPIIHVTRPMIINHVSANYTELYFY